MTTTTGTARSTVTERTLSRSVAKGMATAIPLMTAFSMALVAVAIGSQHPDWGSWLGMAASVGVLAGVFFGAWIGFVANADALDEADLPGDRAAGKRSYAPM